MFTPVAPLSSTQAKWFPDPTPGEPYCIFVRVGAGDEYDRNGCRRRFGGERRCHAPHRDDDSHLTSNQIGRQGGNPIISTLRPAVVDGHVPAFDKAEFVQPFPESGHEMNPFGGRPAVEE